MDDGSRRTISEGATSNHLIGGAGSGLMPSSRTARHHGQMGFWVHLEEVKAGGQRAFWAPLQV